MAVWLKQTGFYAPVKTSWNADRRLVTLDLHQSGDDKESADARRIASFPDRAVSPSHATRSEGPHHDARRSCPSAGDICGKGRYNDP
jgi:hypothetical protein